MTKILGLDLGSASIGFALIEENATQKNIITIGCRIIPLNPDDKNQFSQGQAITKNQSRTTSRTQRKGYDRYQQRRLHLKTKLTKLGMLPDDKLWKLPSLELFGLRDRALKERVSLPELGRILMHLNQKRGYKSIAKEENEDKKATEYVAEVKGRFKMIKELGLTIGQYFLKGLSENIRYRIKDQVFPREAYVQEFEKIWLKQATYYPEVLSPSSKYTIQNEIIYFQRPLKSQKGLVSVCEFEGFWQNISKEEGKIKEAFLGPKVSPKSSPLFQVCKIWETINNLNLKSKRGEAFTISMDKKREIFEHLDNNEKLSQSDLFKIIGLKKDDWYGNKQIGKGLQGNLTKTALIKILGKDHPLLTFNLEIIEDKETETFLVDKKTGEVLVNQTKRTISPNFELLSLYKIWHTTYSIKDEEECKNALIKRFNLDQLQASEIAKIDFTKQAFGNKSAKSIRKILPYLMDGYVYSSASSFGGYNHSNSLTKDEKLERNLKESLNLLPKNSLRQPIVEKVLNQLINLVNSIIQIHGRPDEIRIELARELKQSKDERNEAFRYNSQREKENDIISTRLSEYGLKATRNNIIKWRLFQEINIDESRLNSTCIYCGSSFGITDALRGNNVDVEHIIPKSLLFDNSQSNKTLSHRSCNVAKGSSTAFDHMESKGEDVFNLYLERVNALFKNKIIGKGKRDKLLMSQNNIPKDFIERQLRETQYIAKKAKEILEEVCSNVWSTSGNVTEHLRRVWGWNDVLMNLQFDKYKTVDQTEIKEWETNDGQKHQKEVIKNWSKRDDHRHHAIDALIVASTQQGFIQRLNTLSSKHTRDEMYSEIENRNFQFKEKLSTLDKYLILQRPFSTSEVENAASKILISFKAGKKVATIGKRKVKRNGKKTVVQTGIIEPRGPLSEESVYGKINTMKTGCQIKALFENPQSIVKERIRNLVMERLTQHNNDTRKAISSLKKDPIFLNDTKTQILEYGTMYQAEYVIKYPISSIDVKKAEKIIDRQLKAIVLERLKEHKGNTKNAFAKPLFFDKAQTIKINSVRCFTGLSSVEPINVKDANNGIGYQKFVKPGNNHHIAFYKDREGNFQEHITTFWHAVERKKFGIPVIIEKPTKVWDDLLVRKEELPKSFLDKLPQDGWVLHTTLQQNEMLILGMSQEEMDESITNRDKASLSKYLYRVQKMSIKGNGQIDLTFRHHLETELNDSNESKISRKYYNIQSIGAFEKLNPKKVRISLLGELDLIAFK
jgi:CRISPR-associated endonuclease Csn1